MSKFTNPTLHRAHQLHLVRHRTYLKYWSLYLAHKYVHTTFCAPNISPDLEIKLEAVVLSSEDKFIHSNLNVGHDTLKVRFGLVNISSSMIWDQVVVGKAVSPKMQTRIPVALLNGASNWIQSFSSSRRPSRELSGCCQNQDSTEKIIP